MRCVVRQSVSQIYLEYEFYCMRLLSEWVNVVNVNQNPVDTGITDNFAHIQRMALANRPYPILWKHEKKERTRIKWKHAVSARCTSVVRCKIRQRDRCNRTSPWCTDTHIHTHDPWIVMILCTTYVHWSGAEQISMQQTKEKLSAGRAAMLRCCDAVFVLFPF